MTLLYRTFVRYANAAGGVALAGDKAAALWLNNETQPPFWRGLLFGSWRVAIALGWRAAWLCLRHEAWCEARVRRLGFRRFAYVWFLGVEPGAQRNGHGRRALEGALETMRAQGHQICLLKTESRSNVAFYLGLGFQLADEQVVPATQLRYWLFRRALGAAVRSEDHASGSTQTPLASELGQSPLATHGRAIPRVTSNASGLSERGPRYGMSMLSVAPVAAMELSVTRMPAVTSVKVLPTGSAASENDVDAGTMSSSSGRASVE